MALTKVNSQVEQILLTNPKTRNNDKLLQVIVLKTFYGVNVIEDILSPKVPSLESIRRCRQKLQSEGKYISKNAVYNARQQQQQAYKEFAATKE